MLYVSLYDCGIDRASDDTEMTQDKQVSMIWTLEDMILDPKHHNKAHSSLSSPGTQGSIVMPKIINRV